MEIGALVQYYDEGWRYGYLTEFEEKTVKQGKQRVKVRTGTVKVRPVAAFRAGTPRCVSVSLADIKESEIKGDL